MADDKIPCPHCTSSDTVLTAKTWMLTFHLCMTCGKAFERRVRSLTK